MTTINLLTRTPEIEKLFETELAEKIRKHCPPVETYTDISVEDFKKQYLYGHKPVILKGMAKKWPAFGKWDFDFFKEACGDTKIFANLYTPKTATKQKLGDLITEIQAKGERPNGPLYLQEWCFQVDHPELLKDTPVLEHFKDDQLQKLLGFTYTTLWLGEAEAKTFLHQDNTCVNVWIGQLCGKKEWFLFNRDAFLPYEGGKVDIDSFLNDPKTQACHYVMEPGDILLVPYKWWHRAQGITDSISANTFFATEEIIGQFLHDFIGIPFALILNEDFLKEQHLMRYEISKMRIDLFARLMKYNPGNILGLPSVDLYHTKSVDVPEAA